MPVPSSVPPEPTKCPEFADEPAMTSVPSLMIVVDASARLTVEESDAGIVELMTRSAMLGSADQVAEARARADLLIEPDNDDGVGLLEFHQLDAMRAAGRRAARRALAGLERPLV